LRFFLQKSDRLLKRAEYVELSDSGRKLITGLFIVLAAPAQSGRSRIGITVSRKVGGAIQRNRIKRLAREAFRLNRHLLCKPLDISLIARNAAADQPNRAIARALKGLYETLSRQLEN
jgi:ribonuclease P protein component